MSQPANILIVDDTPENLTVLRDILMRSGYRVRPVLQGALALKSATAEPPDLILLDIMMPGMDGYETCQRLKEEARTRDVPVLFISALDATESKVRGFEAGALDYILKPFRAEEVLARVRTHLALYAAQRQLKAQNEELLRAARLREDVDHMLRHDLRGPLGNMISYAELILEDAGNRPAAAHARVIANAGYAVLNMVHASFDLMKMERGSYELKAEPFDLSEVIRQVGAELELAAARKQLALKLTGQITDLVIKGERLLCHSLFYNLAKNAVEAAPAGSDITFQGVAEAEHAAIRIGNKGAVPEAVRSNFFEKYVTHGKADGTGLGTFSARLMAETQRGRIQLDTTEPQHTTITVYLPLASPAEARAYQAGRVQARRDTAAPVWAELLPVADVLIADDEAANRAYFQHILPAPPLRLHFAAHGREALDILKSHPITAALVDLEMPELNGLELAQAYGAWAGQSGRTPAVLIACSGHQDEATREQCRAAGFARLLPKPTAKEQLYEELRLVLVAAQSVVRVDKDIAGLIPDFMDSQRRQAEELELLLVPSEAAALGSLAHRLQGSLAMYGFDHAARLATDISNAARAGELDRARPLIAALRAHLLSLEIHYV